MFWFTLGNSGQVLGDWAPYCAGLHLYYPNRRHGLAALRAFIDFARAALANGANP